MPNLNIKSIIEGVEGYAEAGKQSDELVTVWNYAGIALIVTLILVWKKFLR